MHALYELEERREYNLNDLIWRHNNTVFKGCKNLLFLTNGPMEQRQDRDQDQDIETVLKLFEGKTLSRDLTSLTINSSHTLIKVSIPAFQSHCTVC